MIKTKEALSQTKLELRRLLRNGSNESHSDINGFALHPADSQGQQTACKPRQSTQIFGV